MKYSQKPRNADNKTDRSVQKQCAVCCRPFSWRKKWERCWEEVRYCSRRCRSQRNRVMDEEK
ncbi:DUF2256 domain-containing protein [Endozoicomonas elysicola]|uniref:DUF2256 domain-containing protein n=1 Tax=Endozoicomonas elysicola TaxID=305900 RepID=UPI0009D9F645|nr:DUF2256 domain-containing protein [Endozoicomonas elysicola]